MMKPASALCLSLALAVTGLAAPSAQAQGRSEQGEARKEMRAGNILPRRQIEDRVFSQLGKPVCPRGRSSTSDNCIEYLAGDYDSAAMAYRFKFIQGIRVFYIDVDARTGRVLNRRN